MATPCPQALIIAPSGDEAVAAVATALRDVDIVPVTASQVMQAFGALVRRHPDGPWVAVIILGPVSGLPAATIAKAVRGLPAATDLRMLIAGDVPAGLKNCAALAQPIDAAAIRRLVTATAADWTTMRSMTPTRPFPAMKPQPGPEQLSRAGPGQQDQRRAVILAVDDHEVNLHVISLLVRDGGHRVEISRGGRPAVERIAAGGVALVLMDCQMPDLDGYTATREIRQLEAGTGRHVPIIAVTASAMTENRERCLAAGMDDFLAKPVKQRHLLDAISRWLPDQGTNPASPPAADPAEDRAGGNEIFDPEPVARFNAKSPGKGTEIFALALADLRVAQTELPRLAADGAYETLSRAAHRIKGATASVGAQEVYRLSAELERIAAQGDRSACQAAVATVIHAIDRLAQRCQQLS